MIVSTLNSNFSLMIKFVVRFHCVFVVSILLCLFIQPLADNSSISYFVILENSCTNTTNTDRIVFANRLVTYTVQYPQNWTNISIVAENNCKSVTLPVNTSSTGMYAVYDDFAFPVVTLCNNVFCSNTAVCNFVETTSLMSLSGKGHQGMSIITEIIVHFMSIYSSTFTHWSNPIAIITTSHRW